MSHSLCPPAHLPWIPANRVTGQSKHISVLSQRISRGSNVDEGIGDDNNNYHNSDYDDDTVYCATGNGTTTTRSSHGVFPGRRPTRAVQDVARRVGGSSRGDEGVRKEGGKGRTQLDRLADIVYDALMCNTSSHMRQQ